jgi:recombination protein RecR
MMAAVYEGVVQDLIDELGRLPGVGPKSAQRMAFYLLAADPADVTRLQEVLGRLKEGVVFCAVCGTVSEKQTCRICADPRRDPRLVCVVEEPKDVLAVERTGEFTGRYHVLGGALDPLSGIGPDQLRIRELLARIAAEEITEVIIATDPNTEGEATATYLARMLRDFPGLSVTRLASGLPMGGDLEFADELTLGRALSGRRAVLRSARLTALAQRAVDGGDHRVERGGDDRPGDADAPQDLLVDAALQIGRRRGVVTG